MNKCFLFSVTKQEALIGAKNVCIIITLEHHWIKDTVAHFPKLILYHFPRLLVQGENGTS